MATKKTAKKTSKKTSKKKAPSRSSAGQPEKKAKHAGQPKDALKVRMFIENVGLGMAPYSAAKHAGCSNPGRESKRYMDDPDIMGAIEEIQRQNQKNSDLTRKDVMQNLIEAFEVAKMQGDPQAMVRAMSEVNRMCGYHAPEKKVLELRGPALEMQAQLDDMSKEDLLEALGQEEETPLLDMEQNTEGVFELANDE